MRLVKQFAVAALLIPLFSGEAQAQTEWNHNGSVMTLLTDGANARTFTYKTPRPGMASLVSEGTVVFQGERKGFTYKGTAYVFSQKCGPSSYPVDGIVSDDHRTVSMTGRAPLRGPNCENAGYRDDTLIFTFIDPDLPKAAQLAQSTAYVPQPKAAEPKREYSTPTTVVSNRYLPTSKVPAGSSETRTKSNRLYDTCSNMWNRDDFGAKPGGKAMVAGFTETATDYQWSCYWSQNDSRTNKDMEESATDRCKVKHDSCYTFALGNNLTSWAERQKNAILDGSRLREQQARAEEQNNRAVLEFLTGVFQGIASGYNTSGPAYSPAPSSGSPRSCYDVKPHCRASKNMECCAR